VKRAKESSEAKSKKAERSNSGKTEPKMHSIPPKCNVAYRSKLYLYADHVIGVAYSHDLIGDLLSFGRRRNRWDDLVLLQKLFKLTGLVH
jgi:hypothetical protein